jgi:uncharacterized protein (TIGR02099 family)
LVMPTPLRRRLRLARRSLWYVFAIGLVLMALAAGILSQLLPLAERHPDAIAAWLSERAGHRVAFDRIETQWTRRGPLLRLDGLRVGEGRQAVLIGDAEMLISQYAGLFPGRSFTELRLRELDLTLERGRDGRWAVRGLPGQEEPSSGDAFDTLQGLGELQVVGGKLTVIAPDLGIDARLPRVDVRLRVDGDRVRAGVRAWARTGSSPVEAALDFSREDGDGRAYLGARRADLSAWTSLLHGAGVTVAGGHGRAQAWAVLRGHRVTTVTVDAVLEQLQLRGSPVPDGAHPPLASRSVFQRVQVRARYRAIASGWRIDAPTLRIASGARTQTLDGLLVAGGRRYGLVAERIDAGPLFATAAMSDRLAPGLRRWLLKTRPQATLRDIVVAGNRGGAMHASGRVEGLAFAAVGDGLGIAGLSGALDGDDRGVSFVFDHARPVRVDWPRGFGVPHVATLTGEIAGWREGDGWEVATSNLRIDGDVDAAVRGGMRFDGHGRSPRLDLAVRLGDTPVTAAKGYWVRHLMSPASVQWLDTALLGGTVRDGRALISGELADWPFDGEAPARDVASAKASNHAATSLAHTGVFQATARVENASLKFHPEWPAFNHVDAGIAFAGEGFTVAGKGVLADVGIRHFEGGIARFSKSELTVQAQGGGDASQLLALMKQSPLHKPYAEAIDNIGASGLAAVDFGLDLPLHDERLASKVTGSVVLAGARLTEKRWKIAFDNVRGRAEYGSGGFAADRLAVVSGGQPGRLSLRAGDYTRDRRQGFEADLDANLTTDELIRHAPELGWLKPYLKGRSAWTVAVAIPTSSDKSIPAAPSRLQLRSDLVGTALDLPAPLRKPASAALPATVDVGLPLGTGEIRVGLGNVLGLRARSGGKTTGVRLALGSGTVSEPPPVSGLIASGRTTTLDALDWIALTRRGGSGGNSMPLRNIDISADRLLLLGAAFPNTRLRVTPAGGGTSVQVQGDALAGNLQVPDADRATISGRFQRVHWLNANPPAAPAGVVVAGSGLDIDPADVPPLSLDIADLRVGGAQLGNAVLRTRPLANGLKIDQLRTRSDAQRIDIDGEWLGRGGNARTRLVMALDSDDFGGLLSGLGYGGQVSGGHGHASLDASWPGTPAAFRLQALAGTLKLAARNGQLVELEPGAGRVLGLLSLAQLPRRLTLDFHDLFSKGFAFDRIDGDVHINAGHARSDNLVIDGPAAEIRIRGAADLAAQQFDQTIDVFPKAGNLLTVAGAIAGGPVGAAIGAAANAVLKKPLGRLAAKTYRVTGPWKEPKVEIIGREQSRAEVSHPPAG